MKSVKLTVGELQAHVASLVSSIASDSTISEYLRRDYACLYGRAPKQVKETAKASGHNMAYKIDFDAVKRAMGTENQSLNQNEAGRLRAYCDFAELALLGVTFAELSEEWDSPLQTLAAHGRTCVRRAEEKAKQEAETTLAVTPQA